MYKAIIIEDEIGSVNVLMQLLADNKYDKIKVSGVADTIQGGLDLIKTFQPDVVFMDIEIKDGSSFQILERLDKIGFKLIFVTAFDKFALEAFRFSAIDYLLKPIDNALFHEAMKKLELPINPDDAQNQYEFLKEIREHNVIDKVNKIALQHNNSIIFEALENIIYLQAKESYTEIYTRQAKKYIMSKNLGHYAEMLSQHNNFYRVHYSTIVNIDYVAKVVKNEHNQQFKIHLQDGKIFEVAHRRVKEFKKFFKD